MVLLDFVNFFTATIALLFSLFYLVGIPVFVMWFLIWAVKRFTRRKDED